MTTSIVLVPPQHSSNSIVFLGTNPVQGPTALAITSFPISRDHRTLWEATRRPSRCLFRPTTRGWGFRFFGRSVRGQALFAGFGRKGPSPSPGGRITMAAARPWAWLYAAAAVLAVYLVRPSSVARRFYWHTAHSVSHLPLRNEGCVVSKVVLSSKVCCVMLPGKTFFNVF